MEEQKVLRLVAKAVGWEEEAREVLAEAASEEFESVIVMGFKQGQLFIRSSSCKATLELIGALEAAKMQLWGAKV